MLYIHPAPEGFKILLDLSGQTLDTLKTTSLSFIDQEYIERTVIQVDRIDTRHRFICTPAHKRQWCTTPCPFTRPAMLSMTNHNLCDSLPRYTAAFPQHGAATTTMDPSIRHLYTSCILQPFLFSPREAYECISIWAFSFYVFPRLFTTTCLIHLVSYRSCVGTLLVCYHALPGERSQVCFVLVNHLGSVRSAKCQIRGNGEKKG
jgi:hypothetical protein